MEEREEKVFADLGVEEFSLFSAMDDLFENLIVGRESRSSSGTLGPGCCDVNVACGKTITDAASVVAADTVLDDGRALGACGGGGPQATRAGARGELK